MRFECPSGAGRHWRDPRCWWPGSPASSSVVDPRPACSGRDKPVVDVDPREPVQLRRGLGAEPDTLDPRLAEDNAALAIAAELHEGLTRSGPDGSVRAGSRRVLGGLRGRPQLSVPPAQTGCNGRTANRSTRSTSPPRCSNSVEPDSTAPYAGLFDVAADGRSPRCAAPAADPRAFASAASGPARAACGGSAIPARASSTARRPSAVRSDCANARSASACSWSGIPSTGTRPSVALDEVSYLTVQDLGTELNLYRTGELDITSEVPNTHVASLQAELARRTPHHAVPRRVRLRSQHGAAGRPGRTNGAGDGRGP